MTHGRSKEKRAVQGSRRHAVERKSGRAAAHLMEMKNKESGKRKNKRTAVSAARGEKA